VPLGRALIHAAPLGKALARNDALENGCAAPSWPPPFAETLTGEEPVQRRPC